MAEKKRYKSPKFQKADAEKLATAIGCSGSHQDADGKWLPCATEDEMQKLSMEAEPDKKPVGFYDKKEGKPKRKKRGKRKRYINDEWENLRQRAPLGFDTLPDGSLVSGNNPPIPAVGETVTAFGGGTIPGITNSGSKSALGASIGERAGGASFSGSSSGGVDRDGDGNVNDGTEDERPAQKKKRDERRDSAPRTNKPPRPRDERRDGPWMNEPPKPRKERREPRQNTPPARPIPNRPEGRDTPARPIPNRPEGRDTPIRPIPNNPIRQNRDQARREPDTGVDKNRDQAKRNTPSNPQPKKKKQKIYKGGRRYSGLMPKGPNPEDYPENEYDLINPDGTPYQRGKSDYDEGMETKAGQVSGPEYVRDNDPDVFMDPESARFRSRQLGCIGISRRISKTGRAVWMPCTNMSDYSRAAGSTSLGRRGQRRDMENTVRTIVSRELKKNKK
jgi:hypothetical protein